MYLFVCYSLLVGLFPGYELSGQDNAPNFSSLVNLLFACFFVFCLQVFIWCSWPCIIHSGGGSHWETKYRLGTGQGRQFDTGLGKQGLETLHWCMMGWEVCTSFLLEVVVFWGQAGKDHLQCKQFSWKIVIEQGPSVHWVLDRVDDLIMESENGV